MAISEDRKILSSIPLPVACVRSLTKPQPRNGSVRLTFLASWQAPAGLEKPRARGGRQLADKTSNLETDRCARRFERIGSPDVPLCFAKESENFWDRRRDWSW